MNRRFGIDVAEGDGQVIFVNDFGRDLAGDDFFEDSFAHKLRSGIRPSAFPWEGRNPACAEDYTTSSEQFPALCSAVRHWRRYSTIWSLSFWQRPLQRRAPASCLTQLRRPVK